MKRNWKVALAIPLLLWASPLVSRALVAPAPERLFYFTDTTAGRTSLSAHIDKIDILAPQVYGINESLSPQGALADDVKMLARAHHIKLMPLIVNDGFSQTIIHSLLASTTAQTRLIEFLVTEAKAQGYAGWQFDLEHIHYTDRDALSSFVEQAVQALHKNNLTLSLAVVVKVNNALDTDWHINWAGAFDYARLARSLDFISIMTYDDPESKGPTASLPFVLKTLTYVIDSGVPASKISLGIPAYYWSWTVGSSPRRVRSGPFSRVEALKSRVHYKGGFDAALGVNWMTFTERRVPYVLWYEDAKSFNLKKSLINLFHLRGFSLWVLGFEDPKIWKNL